MPSRVASISELLNSLDAAEYFFASSAIFVAVTAVLFFGLGLWLGGLLWGRFKRRFRHAESAIESYKGEVALLKHRIAEQSTRHAPGAGPSPLRAIAFRAATPKPLTSSPSAEQPATPPVPTTPHSSRPFTLSTEPSSSPARPRAKRSSTFPPIQPLFSPLDVFMVPRSRAFSVWTENSWSPPVVKSAPAPIGRGFAIWTLPDFKPANRCLFLTSQAHSLWTEASWSAPRHTGPPSRSARSFTLWTESEPSQLAFLPSSRAFTLWTEPSWAAPRHSGPPIRSARSFTLWTEPEWSPPARLPSSRAFTLWTAPEWSPALAKAHPLPPSSAWSLWTCSSFEPLGRFALPPSCAHSLWTEEGWMPDPMNLRQTPPAKAFSIWTEAPTEPPVPPPSPGPLPPKSDAPVPQPIAPAPPAGNTAPQGGSLPVCAPGKFPAFMARALSAAKQALGLGSNLSVAPMPLPAISIDSSSAAPDPVKPSATPPATGLSPTGASVPCSKAFTLWTNGPAHESAGSVSQSSAPALLVKRKTSGRTPPMVPPVPVVPPVGTTGPGSASAPLEPPPTQAMLNLEPLVVPGEASKG